MGINKTDSAFTSVLYLLGEAVNSAGNGQWHIWEGSSRKAVEGPEYQYLLRNLGNGLSVKGLCSTVYPPLSGTCVLDRRSMVGLHSGLSQQLIQDIENFIFSFLELLWDNTGECELKSLIKVSSPA